MMYEQHQPVYKYDVQGWQVTCNFAVMAADGAQAALANAHKYNVHKYNIHKMHTCYNEQ